jgi:AraC family transcriptional regulator
MMKSTRSTQYDALSVEVGSGMNYRDTMERILIHIEHHLDTDLSVPELARMAGYSMYHFCRVFQAYQGATIMEYVRTRRLSLALHGLASGKDGLETALDHGYATHGGFVRAFKRTYGQPPTRFGAMEMQQGGTFMNVQIITKPSFRVAGYGTPTNIAGSFTQEVAAFWEQYEENWEGKLYDKLNPPKHGEVCICLPESRNSSNLVYVMGVIVDEFSKVEPDMVTITVPAATYAVFTTPPVYQIGGVNEALFAQGIRDTWKKVYAEWFDGSGYVFDEDALDFEYYDERCHHTAHSVMDIYVPIKKAPAQQDA